MRVTRNTQRRTKKEREREKHDEIEKAETERPPTLVSCGWLSVADLSLSPIFVSDITQQQLTNFLIILTEACKKTQVGLVETFWSSVDLSSHYYFQSVGGEHWTTLSPYRHSGLFSFKKTQGNWPNKRGSNRIQTTPKQIIKVKTRTNFFCFLLFPCVNFLFSFEISKNKRLGRVRVEMGMRVGSHSRTPFFLACDEN